MFLVNFFRTSAAGATNPKEGSSLETSHASDIGEMKPCLHQFRYIHGLVATNDIKMLLLHYCWNNLNKLLCA
jgi:hypothetical protein